MHPDALKKASRTITATLFAVQSLGSAGIITAATIASIVGAELSGKTSLAGLPLSVSQIGSAFAALLWSFISDRLGRRWGFALGVLTGAIGALLAFFAVLQGSFFYLLLALVLMASAQASFNLGRFVAAEVNPPDWRGRAVATVVLGGTVGSVVGPSLVNLSGRSAKAFELNELAGPYGAIFLLFCIAALVLVLFLRPEPKTLALELAKAYPQDEVKANQLRPLATLVKQPGIIMAVAAMVLAYAVMSMLMGITSLHMKQHDHSLGLISLVFSAHTLGMFAFSVLTGWLIDRWGRKPVILVGALLLIAACLSAPLSPQFLPLAVALFLLGLGWNFCYVGGSTLLSDQLSPLEKARTQGINDWLVGLTSAAASFLSGLFLATIGYGGLSMVGLLLSSLLFLLILWYRQKDKISKPVIAKI